MVSLRARLFAVSALAWLASAAPTQAGFVFSTRLTQGVLPTTALVNYSLGASPAGAPVEVPSGSLSVLTQNLTFTGDLTGGFGSGGPAFNILEVTITDTTTGNSGFIEIQEGSIGTVQLPNGSNPNFSVALSNNARLTDNSPRTIDLGNGRIFGVSAVSFASLGGSVPVGSNLFASSSVNISFFQTVPEPSSVAMVLVGLVGLGLTAGRRRSRSRAARLVG